MPEQKPDAPAPITLADYRPPDFLIDAVELDFDLRDGTTTVRSTLHVRRNPAARDRTAPLVLDGHGLDASRIAIDGTELPAGAYTADAARLRIEAVGDACTVSTEVRIRPEENTALEGLYRAGGMYCTQCEAEGFRRITWYLDRPDVLARFTTRIEADRATCPVLLSNGNPVESGDLGDGRHFAVFADPHPKPCYLFALVAGDLEHLEDHFTTAAGRVVTLRIYTTAANIGRCSHAMASLRNAMRWDEEVYGLSCDLDHYAIVVTDDFNMGAMENKGLNIFNSKFVLARPETATDADYAAIEGVVAHEYFHNWTGNRVTCRDWFQLSLKEGLTVFRDQQFSGDMGSRTIQRIDDVRMLRSVQFPEDAGPLAHPVRPASVIEINNFYTVTVYEKGAEIVRMYHKLLGAAGFRAGMDLYFARFDGQAVTCDDFRTAMADANGCDLTQFGNWYSQAGTPRVRVETRYDPAARTYAVTLSQSCAPTPGLADDQPFHIPIAIGLLDADGNEIPLRLPGDAAAPTTRILELRDRRQTFVFHDVPGEPVPSLLRDFSAPVVLEYERPEAELAFLMAQDTDPFARWDAGQELLIRSLLQLLRDRQAGRDLALQDGVRRAFAQSLARSGDDLALCAELLTLPSETILGDQLEVIDVDAVHAVREFVRRALGTAFRDELLALWRRLRVREPYRLTPEAIARRRLQGVVLAYLMCIDDPEAQALCLDQFRNSDNMTEVLGALANLCYHGAPGSGEALRRFYRQWQDDPLVLDKWFAIQATSPLPGTLDRVRELARHEAFTLRNPNRVRALVGSFCTGNRIHFHDRSGAGYAFLAEHVVALNAINPMIAARMASHLNHWRRFDAERQQQMRGALLRIQATPGLSRDVFEICSKALGH